MRDLLSHFEDVIRLLREPDPAIRISGPDIQERDNQYGSLALSLLYPDDSALHIRLWADCSGEYPQWVSYSFQYQDAQGTLRFRYDNARDHPELPNFPHHLHLYHSRAKMP